MPFQIGIRLQSEYALTVLVACACSAQCAGHCAHLPHGADAAVIRVPPLVQLHHGVSPLPEEPRQGGPLRVSCIGRQVSIAFTRDSKLVQEQIVHVSSEA